MYGSTGLLGAAAIGTSAVLGLVMTAAAAASGGASATPPGLAACGQPKVVPGLSGAQSANAVTIVEVATGTPGGSPLAAEVALMTAYTESSLLDLGSEPGTDSLGLFQQRASQGWGTPAQEENPAEATAMFVSALIAVPGWQSLAPWVAAQDVQRSAYADGSNYQPNWSVAHALLAELGGDPGVNCGTLSTAIPAGPAASFGLPAGYTIPSSADAQEVEAVTYALAQLGKPYVWGAAGPTAFDCSGLTMMAWGAAGIALSHSTVEQLTSGVPVPDLDAISPGDLVLIPGSDGTLAAPGHVGIYLGYGLVESAVDPAQGVIVQSWASFSGGGVSGVRHLG